MKGIGNFFLIFEESEDCEINAKNKTVDFFDIYEFRTNIYKFLLV